MLDVNLVGPFLGIQAVQSVMGPGGSIINVSSLNGAASVARAAAYTTSKFGLRGLTKASALDLGPRGIRVNAILPGRDPTRRWWPTSSTSGRSEIAAGLPLRRIGEPMDVAAAAVFLASDEASWLTGIDLDRRRRPDRRPPPAL